jgi:mono/diheme cytochrome c family protein
MLSKLLKVLGVVVASCLVAIAGVYVYARRVITTPIDIAPPDIQRATEPLAIARGEVLVRTACAGCHVDPATGKFTGSKLDFPEFFGEFYASNLTGDPSAGIGAVSDALLARAIRVGLKRDGRLAAMPRLPELSDQDVAAIIGFLRSPSPDLAPSPVRHPEPRYAPLGTLLVAFLFPAYAQGARRGIEAPQKAANVEYGRYLANGVFDCFECHTEGFGRGKLNEPGLFAGRLFPGEDTLGRQVYAPNLTPHRSGLGGWRSEDFSRALRTGITPDGRVLQPPMMRLRLLDDIEIEALWTYLRSVPAVDHPSPLPRAKPSATWAPAELFVSLGCAGCHAQGQRFADKLSRCVNEPVPALARFIRRAQEFKPDTQMPTYERLIDDATAEALAAWVQEQAARGPILVAPQAR